MFLIKRIIIATGIICSTALARSRNPEEIVNKLFTCSDKVLEKITENNNRLRNDYKKILMYLSKNQKTEFDSQLKILVDSFIKKALENFEYAFTKQLIQDIKDLSKDEAAILVQKLNQKEINTHYENKVLTALRTSHFFQTKAIELK